MRRQTRLSFTLIATLIFACGSMLANAGAQDEPISPVENAQQLESDKTADAVDQAAEQDKTFRQIVLEVRNNEKLINELFSEIPIGFPKKQVEHLARIEKLKKTNEALQSQMESAALKAFQLDPKQNHLAARLVFNSLVKKMEMSPSSPKFDPQGALELAEMMLATELDGEPRGSVRLEDVAYQAFLASYAIEDYARADLMLKKIEEKGIPLKDTMRNELVDAQEKWQRELMIRRLESNTDDLPRVKLETTDGDIVVELFENHAPETVGNFISLVEKKFYNDLTFFLVQPGRIVQTGCPDGDGTGDAGYKIPCECYREQIRHHFTGTLSMANSGRDTGGSQFFITQQRNGHFDGTYTAFGRVIEGMDVVYKMKPVDQTKPIGLTAEEPPTPTSIVKATVIRKRDHAYVPSRVAEKPDNAVDRTNPEQPLETADNINSGG